MKTIMRGKKQGLWLALALVGLWALPAVAQKPATALGREPAWARNVPVKQQQAAAELLEVGNRLLTDSAFMEAEKKYSEALKLWNHPALHYNLALALLNLDRPAEVYEHMVASTLYGEAPLGADRFRHARKYIERMEQEYAWVKLACDPSAAVTLKLEGQHLPVTCARFERLLRPGAYTVSSSQDGYPLPDTELTLAAGQKVGYRLEIETQRRWAAWKPWAVLGAGVAVAAGGRWIHLKSRDDFRAFDAEIERRKGAVPEPELAATHTRAKTLQKVAVGSYALGSAVVVTSMALLYANRPQPRLTSIPLESNELIVAPVVGDGERGFTASFPF